MQVLFAATVNSIASGSAVAFLSTTEANLDFSSPAKVILRRRNFLQQTIFGTQQRVRQPERHNRKAAPGILMPLASMPSVVGSG